jgi:predicted PurR-regulated permease PerM
MCKFSSLIVYIFFYIQKYFPCIGNIIWEQGKPIIRQINEYITQLGEKIENVMDTYFEEFNEDEDTKIVGNETLY